MKRLIIILLIVLSFNLLKAQDTTSNSVQLSWGYGHLMRQDLSFSPMLHKKGSPVNIHAGYEINGAKMTHLIDAKFSIYKPSITDPFEFYWDDLNDPEASYPHNFMHLKVNYSFIFPVYKTDKLSILVGGRQRNRLVASDYLYAISSSFAYYFSFGLDASLHLSYDLNEKNKLGASLNVTLFALNSRSPYLGFDDEYLEDNYSHSSFKAFLNFIGDASFQSYGKAQDLDLTAYYERIISEKWSLIGTYYLGLNFNQSPTTYASIQNVLLIGGKLKF